MLYDHQTRSLWMHITGECFEGELLGKVLRRADTGRHTTWRDWRQLHPDTAVMAQDPRWLGRPADRGYFPREGARSGDPFVPPQFVPTIQTRDPRLELHDLVYGVRVGAERRAYPLRRLPRATPIEEDVGGVPVTIWFDEAARSVGAFDRRVRGRALAFERDDEGAIRDRDTRSLWILDGLCVEGAYQGERLSPLDGLMSEWYGWYATHTDTTIWQRY